MLFPWKEIGHANPPSFGRPCMRGTYVSLDNFLQLKCSLSTGAICVSSKHDDVHEPLAHC